MAKKRHIRWDRVASVFLPIFLLILILCVCCNKRDEPSSDSSLSESPVVSDITGAQTDNVAKDEFVVVLDAGHGGDDSGATKADGSRLEKDDNLKLALAIRTQLLKHPGVNVILTRDRDVFVSLEERCRIANDAKADLFVSLHRNTAIEGNGIEIWVNNSSVGDNSTDKQLAGYIMELLENVGISRNRGIQEGFRNTETGGAGDNYYVNRYSNMPSCLIEMGFLNSDTDNQNFDERLDAYADAIAIAITDLGKDKGMYQAGTAQGATQTETTQAETTQ